MSENNHQINLTKSSKMSWKTTEGAKWGWELTINSWFSNSKIRTMIFDRFKNRSPDFKLFIKLVANRLID